MSSTDLSTVVGRRVRAELDLVTDAVHGDVRRRFPELGGSSSRVRQVLGQLAVLLVDGDADGHTAVLAARCREQARAMADEGRPRQLLSDVYEYAVSLIIGQLWRRDARATTRTSST